MNQFLDKNQIIYYDMTRPKYTTEVFDDIMQHVTCRKNYLDIACGSGQLLLLLAKYFDASIGCDVSSEQVAKAKDNLRNLNLQKEIYIFEADAYNIVNKLEVKEKFDLITVGQAFHWFEEIKFLTFVKELLNVDGILVLTGYKKQHFDKNKQPDLYNYFNFTIQRLIPYFECDVDNIDNAYYKSYDNINKVFNSKHENGIIKTRYFEEEAEVPLKQVFDLLKSWSAYVNYKKSNLEEDPIDELKNSLLNHFNMSSVQELEDTKVNYYNYYFTVPIRNNTISLNDAGIV